MKTPAARAAAWLESNALILDTETTGLDGDAEVIELAVIDCAGQTLIDTLVRPFRPIPADASAIHGITDQMVAAAPGWADVRGQLLELLASGRHLVIYNAGYDLRLIRQSDALHGLETPVLAAHCAMLTYAEHWGDIDPRRGDYRWQRLGNAAAQQGVEIQGTAHRALADCLTTLGILRAMASSAN
ncbi:3'-5' exonuclease [Pseudomonas aeruginosa]|uniref:3'-5' exonuclease n=1 Tax=Pseudomonas aeruginosa TaxID=287 RepID=UPI0022456E07|nr:3'-5' exonuclease [Pseudomonas aeruginosa]MCX2515826.1 3'-5' exonuclease [Pseudomonas aeruginosa]